MRTSLLAIWLGLAALACGDRGVPRPPAETAAAVTDSGADTTDCVRGEAEPFFSGSRFERKSAREATEYVATASPISLTVRHFGCAHYALEFEFVWGKGGIPGRARALQESAGLLESTPVTAANRVVAHNLAGALRTLAADSTASRTTLSELETVSISLPAANTLQVRYDVAL